MSVSDQIVISCDYQSCDQTILIEDDGSGTKNRDARVSQALTEHAWGKTRVAEAGAGQRAVQHCQIHSREMRLLLGGETSDPAAVVLETAAA